MQVKKFEAPTMQEAIDVIKRELGPDAIILGTKENKKGFGLMSKNSVEITAAISEDDARKKQMAEKNLPDDVKEKMWSAPADKQKKIYDNYFERQLAGAKRDSVQIGGRRPRSPGITRSPDYQKKQMQQNALATPPAKTDNSDLEDLLKAFERDMKKPAEPEVKPRAAVQYEAKPATQEVKAEPVFSNEARNDRSDRVELLENELRTLKQIMINQRQQESKQKDDSAGEYSDDLLDIFNDLVSTGIERKYAHELVRAIKPEFNRREITDIQQIQEKLADAIMADIRVENPLSEIGAKNGKSKTAFMSVIGSTGVGKTTTIAKIASRAIIDHKLRVGLINLDSYKVAAADQLSTYAKIMNTPFRSVANKEELEQAIYDFGALDLVLIDTTGRSQKDSNCLQEMLDVLSNIDDLMNVLTVSSSTSYRDLKEIVKRFSIFDPKGIIFSKLDETDSFGNIYNIQKRSHLPLFYFTVGQKVPEDIEKASPERVADLILQL